MDGMERLDEWITGGRYDSRVETFWCVNAACPNHEDGVEVLYESEYGQGWITPEDCPRCGGELVDEPVRDSESEGDS